MARDFDGATQYGHQDTSPITAYPLTVACWFNADTTAGTQIIVQPVGKNGSDGGVLLYLPTNNLRIFVNDGAGSSSSATGTTSITTGTWFHGCGVLSANNSRSVFTNGTNKTTNAAVVNMVATPDRIAVGGQYALAGISNLFNGRVAEVGIWNVALDDDEVAALAKGFSPLFIRPASLIGYWPLLGNESPEQDRWKSKLDFTLVAAPAKADHPRMIYPS